MDAEVAIVFVPFPAQGHITIMLRLARALADRGDVKATVAVPDFVHRLMGQPAEAGAGVALVPLPSGVQDDGGDEPPGTAAIVHAMEHHMPAELEGMLLAPPQRRVSCLVVDVLASWAIPVAARCGVPAVGFWPAMLASYRAVAAIPELIGKGVISESGALVPTSGVTEDQNIGDLHILPTKLEMSIRDLLWYDGGGGSSQHSRFPFWLRTMDRAKTLGSILVNSFPSDGAGDSDRYDPPQGREILYAGPLFDDHFDPAKTGAPSLPPRKTSTTMWQADYTCIDWLDQQSPRSVIYISFGSWVTTIGPDKIAGFARGLEATGRPFLWALKDHPSWRAGLPDRYAEAVAGRGKIVSWAPQEDVLKHEAVGCYIMHGGFISMYEAVQQGVRMICYPIYGDHFVTCAYIVKMWEIGIALASGDQEDVRNCVERVMDGEEGRRLQEKVNELRETIMADEVRSVASRSLDLFMGRIRNDDDTKIEQVTKPEITWQKE
ncbi:hypothetical protein ACP70R_042548 [Stipagrostis hirtigluma subsp. patula]